MTKGDEFETKELMLCCCKWLVSSSVLVIGLVFFLLSRNLKLSLISLFMELNHKAISFDDKPLNFESNLRISLPRRTCVEI